MTRRGASSQRWRQRQERDPYVRRAAADGWRGRAVFKLEEIQRRERILRRGMRCVDLGSSPGSWSQFAARQVGPKGLVLAVDLLPMDAVPGVEFVLGDFTSEATLSRMRDRIGEGALGLVMSDMAPNITGHRDVDQSRSMALAEDVYRFAEEALAPEGDLLVKLFQGAGLDEFKALVATRFTKVKLVKPKASRTASREIYLLARNYRM
jgi:23S rRNA (uridine2552-2'-O)-methyltransferase